MAAAAERRDPASAANTRPDERAASDDLNLRPADELATAARSAGPTNWWLAGLVALAIVIAILLTLQILRGQPGPGVQSGTPATQPQPMAPAAP